MPAVCARTKAPVVTPNTNSCAFKFNINIMKGYHFIKVYALKSPPPHLTPRRHTYCRTKTITQTHLQLQHRVFRKGRGSHILELFLTPFGDTHTPGGWGACGWGFGRLAKLIGAAAAGRGASRTHRGGPTFPSLAYHSYQYNTPGTLPSGQQPSHCKQIPRTPDLSLISTRGAQQGDPCGPAVFAWGLQDMLEELTPPLNGAMEWNGAVFGRRPPLGVPTQHSWHPPNPPCVCPSDTRAGVRWTAGRVRHAGRAPGAERQTPGQGGRQRTPALRGGGLGAIWRQRGGGLGGAEGARLVL